MPLPTNKANQSGGGIPATGFDGVLIAQGLLTLRQKDRHASKFTG